MPALVIYLKDHQQDKSLLENLRRIARRDDVSVSTVVRRTLRKFVSRYNDKTWSTAHD
jgi:hypothetical protein